MTEHSIHSARVENVSRTLLSNAPGRAILVGIELPNNDWPVEEVLDELERLAYTAGVNCIDRVIQRLARPHPGTLLGVGKLQEIAELVKFYDCDGVIFDLELTPRQQRNLENTLEAQVLDRTALILLIFGQRAHTREGRLQVELAQIEYDLPRLARQWTHLSRQKVQLEEELEHVRSHRHLHRSRRKNMGAPVVALVGYTNAGKSTLLNRLAHVKSAAEDKLFATLDPMTKRVRLEGGQEILLTDTVGFVHRLPTTLVAAFRATLEEVAEADLVVHVVDASSTTMQRQVIAVEEVLEEIGAAGRPMLLAFNKVDAVPPDMTLHLPDAVAALSTVRVSALKGEGIDELLSRISENLLLQFVALDVLIPYDHGQLVALFHTYGTIEHESYEENGTHLRGYMPCNQSGPFSSFRIGVTQSSYI